MAVHSLVQHELWITTVSSHTKFSISKAAETWNVARNTLYKAIRDGRLSKDTDGRVDLSEMIRVFGEIKATEQHEIAHAEQGVVQLNSKIAQYEQRINDLETQLQESKERERFYVRQIEAFTNNRIEYKPKGLLGRLFG
jgi:septal ring factor EnvC (AmiA/AmiB activator)